MLVDTHAHLSDKQFDEDRWETLDRAFGGRVAGLVEIADQESQWPAARTLAEQNAGRVFWCPGLHPYYADQTDPELEDRFQAALKHPQSVALGEIGLDYHGDPLPPAVQRAALTRLLSLAVDIGKPVVIHCREADRAARQAQAEMLEIFSRFFPAAPAADRASGVLHCFQGHLDFARACVDRGFMVGVDGPITYPNAAALKAVVQELPLDRLVLETDSPYLPPQPWRGKRNEPSYLETIAAEMARVKGVPLAEVERQTTLNAERLYQVSFQAPKI
jgi:TatD DNase family protein